MTLITDADRHAAQALRVVLADISGFWHQPGDDSPLALALARHRQASEARLTEKLVPLFSGPASDADRSLRPVAPLPAEPVKLSA